MTPLNMNGLDSQNMAQKERVQVDLKTRESKNYEGCKKPKKHEMWWVYGILIIVALFMISAFFH